MHAAPFTERLRELEEWFSDDKSVALRSSKGFQFFPVVSERAPPSKAVRKDEIQRPAI